MSTVIQEVFNRAEMKAVRKQAAKITDLCNEKVFEGLNANQEISVLTEISLAAVEITKSAARLRHTLKRERAQKESA